MIHVLNKHGINLLNDFRRPLTSLSLSSNGGDVDANKQDLRRHVPLLKLMRV